MITILLQTIRPLFILSVMLLYTLGIGIARYTGATIKWNLVLLGLLWLFALQFGGLFLHAYFRKNFKDSSTDEDPSLKTLPRSIRLFIAYAFLAVVASLSVLVIQAVKTPSVILLMFVMVCGVIAYSVPPIQLEYSGYGELVLSLLVANFTPAWGYQLQGGDSLRLLAMVTFPLTALHLAMLLAFSFSSYASDMKYERRTLLLRMGWQNGILLHNVFILCAYLLLMLSISFGLSWQVGATSLLTLPIGILEIWTVNRIDAGAKPSWRALKVMAAALFSITAYLLAFSFWIR